MHAKPFTKQNHSFKFSIEITFQMNQCIFNYFQGHTSTEVASRYESLFLYFCLKQLNYRLKVCYLILSSTPYFCKK